MKKKILITLRLLAVILILFVLALISGGIYYMSKIQYYKPLTFQDVITNKNKIKEFRIERGADPSFYGFPDYEDCEFSSLNKRIKLTGWFIRSKLPSDKSLIIIEGRGVNRLKVLKYLDIIKDKNINEQYNIFLPDMRNSGGSSPGKTGMGYFVAEDIAASMIYLHDKYGINSNTPWVFSQSGMAFAVLAHSNKLNKLLSDKKIMIDKAILDSPLANVFREIKFVEKLDNYSFPSIISDLGLLFFTFDTDFYPPKMRLGELLKNTRYPVLIIQSKEDDYTPYCIFNDEVAYFGENVTLKLFDKGKHVSSYIENKDEYTNQIYEFIYRGSCKNQKGYFE